MTSRAGIRPPVEESAAWARVAGLATELVEAWGSWAPTLTADGTRVAFVSDRTGSPRLWVQDVPAEGERPPEPAAIALGPDPVVGAHWSPDGAWIACALATDGGVRTEVWVVRPDGTQARRVAGGDVHAVLGPWAREGHGLVVTLCAGDPRDPHQCLLIDPAGGAPETIAAGDLITMLDLSGDGRFALLRDGTRGAQFCRLVDRDRDADYPVLPYPETGDTDVGLMRPAPAPRPGRSTPTW